MTYSDKSQLGSQLGVSIDSVINQMKRTIAVETDAQLATALGVQPSAVAQWRRRNALPQKALLKVGNIVFARERAQRAAMRGHDYTSNLGYLSRAVAMMYAADALEERKPAAIADKLLEYVLFLDDIASAALVLLTRYMDGEGMTEWEAFQKVLASDTLRDDIKRVQAGIPA